MNQSGTLAAVPLLIAFRMSGQQLPPEIQKLMDVKQDARVLLGDVPNYSCLETIDRSWEQSINAAAERDIMHVQVSVNRSRESFASPGSKLATTGSLALLSEGGLTVTGLFSMFAYDLFTISDTRIFGAESDNDVLRYDFMCRRDQADGVWFQETPGRESANAAHLPLTPSRFGYSVWR